MAENNPKATLKDVARLAGTSVATASVVLSTATNKYVSGDLRERVLEAARQLHYRPNIPARRMKGKSGRMLAILVPQFENVFFNRVVIGAERYANNKDYTLSIYSTYDEEDKELKFIENLLSQQVDGILISPARRNSRSVNVIREAGIPFVVIDRAIEGDSYDLVAVDNYHAAYQGTKHLIEAGHRKIALFGWQSDLCTITDRVQGFLDATRDAGLDPSCIGVFESERSREAAFEMAMRVLATGSFTAVLAAHHHLAEGIIDSLRVLGRNVPDDISIMIYGNPTWASITFPRFSCIIQPDLELGRKAAELIIDQLENPSHIYKPYILSTELCLRESIRSITATA